MDKKALIITILIVVAIVIIAAMIRLPEEESDTMNFNGVDYTYDGMVAEFGTEDVDGKTGVPLGDIMLTTDFADLDANAQNDTLFSITADDGWQKNVSWSDVQTGILVEEDHMTYFPDLPGAYKIKNLVSIDDIDIGPIAIITADAPWSSAAEVTWTGLFAEIDEVTFTDHNQNMTGIELVDVFNYTGFRDLENATFTFEGVDGYAKSVNYTEVQAGYLVEDGMKTYFVNLTGQYQIKNMFRIVVEY